MAKGNRLRMPTRRNGRGSATPEARPQKAFRGKNWKERIELFSRMLNFIILEVIFLLFLVIDVVVYIKWKIFSG
jgi:hypothetical protein